MVDFKIHCLEGVGGWIMDLCQSFSIISRVAGAVGGCPCTCVSNKQGEQLIKQQLFPCLGILAWNKVQPYGLVG